MSERHSQEANVRAPSFYVLTAAARCDACGADSRVLALALPEAHEVVDETDIEWVTVHGVAVLSFVAQLPAEVSRLLQNFCAEYRLTRELPAEQAHWANHCGRCAAMFDEETLHSEPDVAFLPFSEAAASRIVVHRIDEPFNARAGGMSLAPQFFNVMRRV